MAKSTKMKNKTVAKSRTMTTKATVSEVKAVLKASGRFPAWVKTKPQKTYVLSMRGAGSTYTLDTFKAYRKATKLANISAKAK
tara:strand:- start:3666 stop:3914 length:249 start_codon:yes stop_codon:yes gene_type:complete